MVFRYLSIQKRTLVLASRQSRKTLKSGQKQGQDVKPNELHHFTYPKDQFAYSLDLGTASNSMGSGVLDELFQDGQATVLDTYINGVGFKLEKQVLPDTQGASGPVDLRGIANKALEFAFQSRFHFTSKIHSCPFFDAHYFPPWHFVAHARKSRPSFVGLHHQAPEFNGNKEMLARKKELVNRRSKFPTDYAYLRKATRLRIRQALWTSLDLNNESVDGVYLFFSKMYPYPDKVLSKRTIPNDQDGCKMLEIPYTELDKNMDIVVKKAVELTRDPNSKQLGWVDNFNKKINWKFLETQFLSKSSGPSFKRLQKGEGLKWR